MSWKFDPISQDIVWIETVETVVTSGSIEFGSAINGDISLDTGLRTNDTSIIDSGLRVV